MRYFRRYYMDGENRKYIYPSYSEDKLKSMIPSFDPLNPDDYGLEEITNFWTDLRTVNYGTLTISKTSTLSTSQNATHGMLISGALASGVSALRIDSSSWSSSDMREISLVFSIKDTYTSFCVGICDTSISLNGLTDSYRETDFAYHFNSTGWNDFMYGKGIGGLGEDQVLVKRKFNISTDANRRFYKVVFEGYGSYGNKIYIYEVDPDDLENNLELIYEFTSKLSSQSSNLAPCFCPNSLNSVHLVAYKIV